MHRHPRATAPCCKQLQLAKCSMYIHLAATQVSLPLQPVMHCDPPQCSTTYHSTIPCLHNTLRCDTAHIRALHPQHAAVACCRLQEQRVWVAQPESALTTYDAAAATRRQYMGLAGPQLDYYALLEVPRDATPQQIKRQYYVLARKYGCVGKPAD